MEFIGLVSSSLCYYPYYVIEYKFGISFRLWLFEELCQMIEVYVCQKFALRSIVYCSFFGVDLNSIRAGFMAFGHFSLGPQLGYICGFGVWQLKCIFLSAHLLLSQLFPFTFSCFPFFLKILVSKIHHTWYDMLLMLKWFYIFTVDYFSIILLW